MRSARPCCSLPFVSPGALSRRRPLPTCQSVVPLSALLQCHLLTTAFNLAFHCLGLAERWCGAVGRVTRSLPTRCLAGETTCGLTGSCPHAQVADPLSAGKWRKIIDFAPAMWSSDYRPFLRIEDPAAQAALDALPQSLAGSGMRDRSTGTHC